MARTKPTIAGWSGSILARLSRSCGNGDQRVDRWLWHSCLSGAQKWRGTDALSDGTSWLCRPEGEGKPCWVTEWGIANTALSCPVDDRERERAIRAVRRSFAALMEEGRLDAAFYYDWDTQPVYSVWRCGVLSAAGVAATEANTGQEPAR